MKHSDHSNQPPRRGGGQPRRPQNRSYKSESAQPRQKGSGNPRNKHATELWMSPTSQTLTSHISIVARNQRTGQGNNKKQEGRNGNTGNAGNGRYGKPWAQQDRPPRQHRQQGGQPPRSRESGAEQELPQDTRAEAAPRGDREKLVANIEPFDLFCAYHLGMTQDRRFKPANINEVANRFRVDPATIRQALKEYEMDSASLLDRDFDMALSQLDIQVCPEGVDRLEIAKTIYSDFLEAPRIKRDWNKILEEDRKENQKVFKD